MGTHYKGSKEEVLALNIFIKLLRSVNSLSSRIRASTPDVGLTESQFGVLETLYHLGPLCQLELGRKNLKSGGNMTMVIDNLEKRGFVERVREEADRRFITVHLTSQGEKLISELFPQYVKSMVKEIGCLTVAEQKEFERLCKKLGLGKTERG